MRLESQVFVGQARKLFEAEVAPMEFFGTQYSDGDNLHMVGFGNPIEFGMRLWVDDILRYEQPEVQVGIENSIRRGVTNSFEVQVCKHCPLKGRECSGVQLVMRGNGRVSPQAELAGFVQQQQQMREKAGCLETRMSKKL